MTEAAPEQRRSLRARASTINLARDDSAADSPNPRKRRAEDDIEKGPRGGKRVKERADGKTKKRRGAGRPPKRSIGRESSDIVSNAGDASVVEEQVELLPNKVHDGQPLPTLKAPQSQTLSAEDYQTIAQCGVLAAALKRSRDAWVSGAHFKKQYTKTVPKKPKDRTEADKQQMVRDKLILKNMVRIGDCDLTIEPHIFRIALYMNREAHIPHKQQVWTQPNTTYGTPHQHRAQNHATPIRPQPAHHNLKPSASTAGTPQSAPPKGQRPTTLPLKTSNHPADISRSNSSTPISSHGKTASPANQAAPDPVIQLLAQRAGQDPQLKEVMKIVAGGTATPEQLAYFQGHINQLNAHVEAQEKAAAKKKAAAEAAAAAKARAQSAVHHGPGNAQAQPPIHTSPLTNNPSSGPQQPGAYAQNGPPHQPPQPNVGPPRAPSHASHRLDGAPPQIRAPYPPPPPVTQAPPTFRPIFFEFLEGPGDRLIFPEHSILEYLPGGRQVRFSFVVTKPDPSTLPSRTSNSPSAASGANMPALEKPSTTQQGAPGQLEVAKEVVPGSQATDTTAQAAPTDVAGAAPATTPSEPRKEVLQRPDWSKLIPPGKVYQPLTAMLYADDPRTLECLMRAVRHPSDVCQYMDAIFDAMDRVEERFLALRLPKENQLKGLEEIDVEKENATPEVVVGGRRGKAVR